MRPLALLLCLTLSSLAQSSTSAPSAAGPLVIVGGGGTPDAAKRRALELTGKKDTRVLVFPQASKREEAGREQAQMWREAGATRADVANLERPKKVREQLARADLVWFGGGDQSRLVRAVKEAGLLDALHARHRAGAVFGGTSAGAAVMSDPMIIGGARTKSLVHGGTPLGEGFGFLPGCLVDQHFLARRRFNRLLSAVIAGPTRLGFGVDERTAMVVRGDRITVVGEGSVTVLDAASAAPEGGEAERPLGFEGVKLHSLVPGMTFSLTERRMIR